jgi:predicted nucleotidyltransferase component of viral defense system
MPYDLEELAVKTGIKSDKLGKEIKVMGALQELTMIFGNENQKIGLYGGTALNKIYFGDRQRLSYDLDIEAFSYKKTAAVIRKVSESEVPFHKTARFIYKEVQIDFTSAIGMEEPVLCKASSLLSNFGYPIATVNVPSYSLEYLMARKTMALLSRMLNKDIYDAWMGLNIMKDAKKYKLYVKKLVKKENADLNHLIAQLNFYSKNKFIKDTATDIEALRVPMPSLMVTDILNKLEEFGLK